MNGAGRPLSRAEQAATMRRARRRWIVRGLIGVAVLAVAFVATAFALARDRGLRFVPHPDADLERGACVLWCATAQQAWDGMAAAIGAGVKFRGRDPIGQRAIDALDRRPFPRGAVDPAATALVVWNTPGPPAEGDVARMRQLLGERFELPRASDQRGIAVLAALAKRLPFAERFDVLDEPIRFAWAPLGVATGVSVRGFGFVEGGACSEQVELLAWEPHREEFVLELRPADAGERILIAKVDPADTLDGTWEKVRAWCASSSRRWIGSVEGLRRVAIPCVELDTRQSFDAVVGARSLTPPPGFELTHFEQWNRFRLDHEGAIIESTTFAGALSMGPPPEVDFVVDRPFLLALKRADADVPYLLLWVGGPAVLVRR